MCVKECDGDGEGEGEGDDDDDDDDDDEDDDGGGDSSSEKSVGSVGNRSCRGGLVRAGASRGEDDGG